MDELGALARCAAAGDAEAVAELVRRTQQDVWRFCAHLASPAQADDLTQETYLRALRGLRGYAGRAPFRVWLLGIARRVAADAVDAAVRERRRRQRLAAQPAQPVDGAAAVGDPANGYALRALIGGLEPDQRQAFVLTQVLGLSYAEAAQVCGCPVGTIRSRVARARERLVAELCADAPEASPRRAEASTRRANRRRG